MLVPAAARAQCPDGTPPPCRGARAAAPAPANSIAVLYFDNLSSDSTDAYLADGITEEVISRLGDVGRLTVKSRYAVRRYRAAAEADPTAIGRTLGVAYLVTGSVQRGGGRLRVRAELARASTGNRVWGQQYERGDGDILAITEDIARSVVTGVAGRLLPAERTALQSRPTRNNAAYDHLLRGDLLLARRTPVSVQRAIAEYNAATRLDSGLVSGWAKIALAYAIWIDWGWSDDGRPAPDSFVTLGLAAASRALALDSSSSDAWMGWAYMQMWRYPRTYEGAEAAFRRSVALDPRNAEAWHQLGDLMSYQQRLAEEAEAYRAALAAEPGRPITLANLSAILPPREGLALLDSALAIDPMFLPLYTNRFGVHLMAGDTVGARADVEALMRYAPAGTELLARAGQANALLRLGDSAAAIRAARNVLAALPAAGPIALRIGDDLIPVLVAAADTNAALDLLERLPRGAQLWTFLGLGEVPPAIAAIPRVHRLIEESRPPWAPAPDRR
jgi:TolB-like protein/Tfp pilus assembly protein PilF